MSDFKNIDVLVLGTITSGICLKEINISELHEAVEHIAGCPVWTHELNEYTDKAAEILLKKYTYLLKLDSEDFNEMADRIARKYGDKLRIEKGTLRRERHPLDTLMEVAGDRPIIAIIKGDENETSSDS